MAGEAARGVQRALLRDCCKSMHGVLWLTHPSAWPCSCAQTCAWSTNANEKTHETGLYRQVRASWVCRFLSHTNDNQHSP